MRTFVRRLMLLGASLSALGLLASSPADAGTCYTITVDGQGVTVCPYD